MEGSLRKFFSPASGMNLKVELYKDLLRGNVQGELGECDKMRTVSKIMTCQKTDTATIFKISVQIESAAYHSL